MSFYKNQQKSVRERKCTLFCFFKKKQCREQRKKSYYFFRKNRRKIREFIAKLNKEIEGLEIIEVDERLTTVSADRMLNESNKKGALEKRKVVDKIAAAIILQTFLDTKR